nr:hypothetical protein [uncultured Cohaesibacter sp.]
MRLASFASRALGFSGEAGWQARAPCGFFFSFCCPFFPIQRDITTFWSDLIGRFFVWISIPWVHLASTSRLHHYRQTVILFDNLSIFQYDIHIV